MRLHTHLHPSLRPETTSLIAASMDLSVVGTPSRWNRMIVAIAWGSSQIIFKVIRVVACAKTSLLLMLGGIPLYVCATGCVSLYLSTDVWVLSTFWLL